MTWSYSGDPSANKNDEVRFHCGDTNTSNQLASDEEISYTLTKEPNVYRAAALVCDAIALRLGNEMDSEGETGFKAKEKYDQYRQKAEDLRAQAKSSGVKLFAGGISQADRDSRRKDTDRIQPVFTRDMNQVHLPPVLDVDH
jgi:hypothetical protein